MENFNNNTQNQNKNKNDDEWVMVRDSKSRASREGFPENAVSIAASASSDNTQSKEKKIPTIKDISGFDRKVMFVNRPGPACKTRRKIEQAAQEEGCNKPFTSGIKRPISPDGNEDRMKMAKETINTGDSREETGNLLEHEDNSAPTSSTSKDKSSSLNLPVQGGIKKRGRGRPATSGQYVGLAKAKAKLLEEEERELQLLAEKELFEQEATRRETRLLLAQSLKDKRDRLESDEEDEEQPRRKILMQEALDSAQTVLDVAKKSANLKGTMVKLLQTAAGNIISTSRGLATLSANCETKALERENRMLKEKLTRMEEEVETLKREMREVRLSSYHHPTGVTVSTTDLHESRSSALSAMAESNDRNTAMKLLKERREKKGLKKGKTDTTSSETSPILSFPPFSEGQGVAMEMEVVGQAVQSLSIEEEELETTKIESTTAEMSPEMETMMGNVIRQIGNMISARFAAIEDRLLPEKLLRPPLKADREREKTNAALETGRTTTCPPAKEKTEERAKEAGKKKSLSTGESTEVPPVKTKAVVPVPAPPRILPTSQPYAEGVKKGRKGKKKGTTEEASEPSRDGSKPFRDGSLMNTRASSTHIKADGLSPSDKGPPKKSRKERKTAAVVVTIRPLPVAEGEESTAPTLTAVLQEATSKIDIKELGIDYLRPKRAKTGGLILEIPGEMSTPKADRLAEKLKEVVGNNEEVNITRPIRMAELKLTGLDDAATIGSVTTAVMEAGGCAREKVKVGELRQAPSGLKSTWVKCPKNAADKIIKSGRIKMGWTMAKVETLKTRPLQCHKCLNFGHVKARCTIDVNRSGNCYRCGVPGHQAAGCTAPPNCQLCEAKGKEKGHRLGGPSCPSSPNYKNKGKQGERKEKEAVELAGKVSRAPRKGKEDKKQQQKSRPKATATSRSKSKDVGKGGKGVKPNVRMLPVEASISKEGKEKAQGTSPKEGKARAISSRMGTGLEEAMDTS